MAEQFDLFDQPIPGKVHRLTFNQGMRLFYELHWGNKKPRTRCDAICRYMVEYFDGRFLDLVGRQDTRNLLTWLRTARGQGAWALIKARAILRLLYNLFELWKEDGFVGGYDLKDLALPRKNPTFKTESPQPPKPSAFLTPSAFRGWIKASKKAGDFGFEAAFKAGLWFRLSPIDIENLNDQEVNNQDMEIRVYRRHTRTDKNPQGCLQVIKLTEKAWGFIESCRRYRRPGETRIIPIHVNQRRRFAKIRKIAKGMGLADITLSAFRRSATDHLLERGFSRDAVADAAGHTTTKVLDFHYSSKKHAPFRREVTKVLVENFKG